MSSVNTYRKSDIPEHLLKYFQPAEMGLEPTLDGYVTAMRDLFRDVRRVLRDDGTLWLNLGDTFIGGGRGGGNKQDTNRGSTHGRFGVPDSLEPKNLAGIPWRVAFALQADGWILRNDIIFSKPNPMPESVTDRCTKAHEYVFMFAKQPKYHFDAEAIAECAAGGREKFIGDYYGAKGLDVSRMDHGRHNATIAATRSCRTVWEMVSENYPGAHFAVMPRKLAERCILAGCPAGGTVFDPFGGSGTTAWVAQRNGCKSISVELNEEYCEMFAKRFEQRSLPGFAEEVHV